jgi:hypothetical protein
MDGEKFFAGRTGGRRIVDAFRGSIFQSHLGSPVELDYALDC